MSQRQFPLQALATVVVLAAAIVAGAILVQRYAGGPSNQTSSRQSASASPSASASASPSVSVSPIAAGPTCSTVSFGAPLSPLPGDAGKHSYAAAPPMAINPAHKYLVTMKTNKGTITICLDPALAPVTVNNFVFLARNQFYDGLKFHRVVAGFVIQGGDPLGTGSGGPGYKFADEPVRSEYIAGALAMANSGPNTNGSQFFICTVDDRSSLAKSYNLFGFVQSGMDVVLKIQQGDVMQTVTVSEQQ
ncbi:MAG TPA: peptidylprolyl isomerase [Candidatus Limnocylindrales bacterium]|nr:peptidylprolyl isomerase [Candidatus Limnocylindrales bacterium]